MEFVETHAHLDDAAFSADLPAVLEAARNAGVHRFVNIGYEPESWTRTLQLADTYPDISYALGMHPNSADRWTRDTQQALADLLGCTHPVAVGEIGLDTYREWVDISAQRAAFRDQLELATHHALPVVIHMRGDVEQEMASTLASFPDVRAVFHSFDGSEQLRDFALEHGHSLGVGGLLTRSGSAALRETLRQVPLESFLLETDAPYLIPRGLKNRRNEPANLTVIAGALADLLDTSLSQVAAQTTTNAMRFYGLTIDASSGAAR